MSTREPMKSTYCPAYHVHTTHTFKDTSGRDSTDIIGSRQDVSLGAGPEQSRGHPHPLT